MGVGGGRSDVVDVFEEMEGKSCVWAEDDVVTAVGIFVLCLDDSGARHIFESEGLGCEQFIHFGSRMQSIEECPADAHLEHVCCPRQDVCECPNLWHLKQCRGFGMRRIPCDFQRTSLAGLALDSATSSGLGRAPLYNAGPHPAPPGTTRQAGLYTS
ncbi:hypothetical protein TNCV_942791 [Trichonephila clavipes]|nr:hypothetical protein TNCV_942791 [Trichonephila clavipes]